MLGADGTSDRPTVGSAPLPANRPVKEQNNQERVDRSSADGLLADFGDIEADNAGNARWAMTCPLYGTLTNFTADFSHADELGGQLTSLIAETNIHTHTLVRDVRVDDAGSDEVRDFLAQGYRVYESDGSDSAVSDLSGAATLTPQTVNYRLDLSGAPATGCVYVSLANPEPTNRVLDSVIRSDGKRIRPENAWLARTREGSGEWQEWLRVFDVNVGACGYVVRYGDRADENAPPVLMPIGSRSARAAACVDINVQATDDSDVPTLATGPLPAGASFADAQDGTGAFDWTPTANQLGDYRIRFIASDGELSTTETVVLSVTEEGVSVGPDGMLMRVW